MDNRSDTYKLIQGKAVPLIVWGSLFFLLIDQQFIISVNFHFIFS
ncbi:hypothetical protein HMPREF9412_0357 [Paenibacillus sp. HGF5]|nr:hypothetical protein HMPREF9412_0357 [Paenibacillus sp. HGF5]